MILFVFGGLLSFGGGFLFGWGLSEILSWRGDPKGPTLFVLGTVMIICGQAIILWPSYNLELACLIG